MHETVCRIQTALTLAKDALGRGEAPEAVIARLSSELEAVTRTESAANFPTVSLGRGPVLPPTWIVKGLLTADSFCVIYGASGAGKSFFALDLAASVASGRSFHGSPVRRPGGVLYIAGEGRAGLESRLSAWQKSTGQSLADAPLRLNARAANLIADADAAERDITVAARAIPDLRLIIIDTWSRCLGWDDSAPSDAARGVQVLDNIRRNLPGVAVVIITHTGHASKDRARGWYRVYEAADISYRLDAIDDTLVLTADKRRGAALPKPVVLDSYKNAILHDV